MKDTICTEGQDTFVLFFCCFVIPFIGCILAILFHNAWWLILLAPLLIFGASGLFLIGINIIVVSYLMG